MDVFTRQVELPRYSGLVPVAEIRDQRNDYNLNLPRYIDSTEQEDLQDIDGHQPGSSDASGASPAITADGSPILIRGSVAACMIAADESGLHIVPIH